MNPPWPPPPFLHGGKLDSLETHTVQRETFEGENFCDFQGFVAIHENFSAKFGDVVSFGSTSVQYAKVFFFAKMIFSTNSQIFSPLKVSVIVILNFIRLSVSEMR